MDKNLKELIISITTGNYSPEPLKKIEINKPNTEEKRPIENDKKWKKISDTLESFGYRVNYSVFECELNQTKLKKLVEKLNELIDIKYDSLRFYHICENCVPKSFELCKKGEALKIKIFYNLMLK